MKNHISMMKRAALMLGALALGSTAMASEADLKLPDLSAVKFFSDKVTGTQLMLMGIVVCVIGLGFALWQYLKTEALPVHKSMSDVSAIIWETCKSYLAQQGKFLALLWSLIAICMVYYFGFLTPHDGKSTGTVVMNVAIILCASILGILGSYGVAWFGMRINTFANSRSAFASLRGTPGRPWPFRCVRA
jgi:K(+)-stimulated pyrophosphate-energized sodium pump